MSGRMDTKNSPLFLHILYYRTMRMVSDHTDAIYAHWTFERGWHKLY